MPKRESKGQKVKTFKAHIPDDRGEHEAKIVTVYLQVGEALCFVAWLPEHIGKSLPALDCYKPGAYFKGGGQARFYERDYTVRSSTIDTLMEGYSAALRQYAKMLTEQNVEPVLFVDFKANLHYDHERGDKGDFTFGVGSGQAVGAADIPFANYPAISLVVHKLWRQPGKDTLYHKKVYYEDRETGREALVYDGASLGPYADAAGRKKWEKCIIPWTQEREDFLRGIVSSIEKLGWLMKDFMKDFEGNITYALENGARSLMLAPPKPADPPPPPPAEFDRDGNLKLPTGTTLVIEHERPPLPEAALPKIRHRERNRT